MKYLKVLFIVFTIISIQACEDLAKEPETVAVKVTVSNKKEYNALKDAVEKCTSDFKEKTIAETKYSEMMENFGDIYVESVDAIPPERRYTMAIFCYKTALKHNRSNKILKQKLQSQQALYQVVNQ